MRIGWRKRREKLSLQENCLFDWQNLIAEAARKGNLEEEELQWESYEIINERLKQEWVASIEHRKTMPGPKASKRAPKSLEQRRKIAEAIAAKWADPVSSHPNTETYFPNNFISSHPEFSGLD